MIPQLDLKKINDSILKINKINRYKASIDEIIELLSY